jgi:sulfur carrier protein
MRILVNGDWRDTAAGQLSAVLEELGYGQSVVTTAVNGQFVAATVRPRTQLAEGDRIEVLAPMQGG